MHVLVQALTPGQTKASLNLTNSNTWASHHLRSGLWWFQKQRKKIRSICCPRPLGYHKLLPSGYSIDLGCPQPLSANVVTESSATLSVTQLCTTIFLWPASFLVSPSSSTYSTWPKDQFCVALEAIHNSGRRSRRRQLPERRKKIVAHRVSLDPRHTKEKVAVCAPPWPPNSWPD